ncbi:Glu-tRNA(Gln) amidotransferase subunit GatD [Methanococcus aeolicus]|uniref:Glutamyl-tRNA(Gln) amidotransferase subunit D n=1 Tax=Methanococcus aeolicus (strain ATCC BAA-1280 / DSM 17508 / OCM 812 / Nankai-3) TaxID=419665 RepID=A6UWS4_META3|nr:Glu-tRNA(Gln) amidotransferase subunit GatD [Methanococcus aeolicus]ABR56946.1 glutamyl-tRNA(Gln) amidotransferase, subunit D [Methanococcus aeolicus Nankai-3]UXM84944.1 Glu-tRNA(Gln) amidotransferase subunit GatD [Methanococcus aeolicus]
MDNYDIGDLITIETENTTYTGTIMPSLNDNIIVIKMKSGYNAGIDKNKIKLIKLINKGEKPNYKIPPLKISENNNLKNISILSTGGTVASRVDYNTGAVHPAFTADDLIRAVPELLDIANINGKVVLNILSENMTPTYWKMIAEEIEKEVKNGADGIVIAHGTDTMHYTACALSFMVDADIPIVLVGAQRSSDRPSSDAALNLISATMCATEQIKGVFVVMHGESGDTVCHLHRGVKVRKSHSTRRDAFKSINSIPVAEINPFKKQIKYLTELEKTNKNNIKINTNLEEKVALIKIYPGIDGNVINYYVDNGYKGIIIEGTGLGHTPETIFENIKYATDKGVLVAMTTQTINGRVNMNVYSNGRELQKLGVISCEDMLPEVALVKMMHLLGNYDTEKAKELMNKNLVGEITEISRFDSY